MDFRFYTNAISQASKTAVAWFIILGLLLIGFGLLVYVLKEIFAILAAAIFFVAGIGCWITGVKIWFAQRRFDKMHSDGSEGYRKNVRIHYEEHDEI